MRRLDMTGSGVNTRHVSAAAAELARGQLIVVPTDTHYALACDALNQRAIERLCKLKGLNPEKNMLSAVCADISQASSYAKIDNKAFAILRQNLPGPYTFVLPASTRLPKAFKGRKTVGIRIPSGEIAAAVAAELDGPIVVATIENEEALSALENEVAIMLDAGEAANVNSTVVSLLDSSSPEILRQGLGQFE